MVVCIYVKGNISMISLHTISETLYLQATYDSTELITRI